MKIKTKADEAGEVRKMSHKALSVQFKSKGYFIKKPIYQEVKLVHIVTMHSNLHSFEPPLLKISFM